jgi:hypothetical protein
VKLRAEQGEQQGLEILPHPPLVHAQYAQGLLNEEEVAAFAGAAGDAAVGDAAAGGGDGGGVSLEGRQSTPPLRCCDEVVCLIKRTTPVISVFSASSTASVAHFVASTCWLTTMLCRPVRRLCRVV